MYLTFCCLHLTQLPYELRVIEPHKEYFVGHSDERMEERIHAVCKAKNHVLALIKEKSYENQDEYYGSSSESSDENPFEKYPASSHGGHCKIPFLADSYPGPTFTEKFFEAFKYCHASTLGFEYPVIGHPGESSCFCPCSKFMKSWRDLFDIEKYMDDNFRCNQNKYFDPEAFLQHLTEKQSCPLHAGILKFVQIYYADFNGKKRCHYALMKKKKGSEYDFSILNHGTCLMKVPHKKSTHIPEAFHLLTSFKGRQSENVSTTGVPCASSSAGKSASLSSVPRSTSYHEVDKVNTTILSSSSILSSTSSSDGKPRTIPSSILSSTSSPDGKPKTISSTQAYAMSKGRGYRKSFNFDVMRQQNMDPFLHGTKMPVSSEENTCKDNNLVTKGEVRAFSQHSKKPVSSEEFTCKQQQHCQGQKEPALKEDGEVGAS